VDAGDYRRTGTQREDTGPDARCVLFMLRFVAVATSAMGRR
jgi:hypothetical protein